MDKTLNRPLFKKRAQEIYQQVNPKQVPKFFLGGIMQAGNMIRAGAAPAYRYLAPKVSAFMNRPAVQTGIVGLEGYGIGVGSQDMAQGVVEGDTGKFLQGAAFFSCSWCCFLTIICKTIWYTSFKRNRRIFIS
jgi:hypothetical protein